MRARNTIVLTIGVLASVSMAVLAADGGDPSSQRYERPPTSSDVVLATPTEHTVRFSSELIAMADPGRVTYLKTVAGKAAFVGPGRAADTTCAFLEGGAMGCSPSSFVEKFGLFLGDIASSGRWYGVVVPPSGQGSITANGVAVGTSDAPLAFEGVPGPGLRIERGGAVIVDVSGRTPVPSPIS